MTTRGEDTERPTAFAAERFSEDLHVLTQDDLSSDDDELAHALAAGRGLDDGSPRSVPSPSSQHPEFAEVESLSGYLSEDEVSLSSSPWVPCQQRESSYQP